ncbi:hypothetical protein O181_093899 [Austropuccinia psidii MF-1]|uniref:Uncharacterized protein n=1 Tax=Austropuccinia psidii MF-1 TaxID=1389203 RepID=A0A9Q3J2D0_9BASI|nr:hypothetical protein [Austropuccinia psidii MF-1]
MTSRPRRRCEDSFVADNDESIPKREWTPGPQTARREQFWTVSPVPSSIDLLTQDPMVTSLLDRTEVIICPMKDGDGKRKFELGPIITMGFECKIKFSFSSLTHFSSCNHTDFFPLHIEQNQPNPPGQDSPVPSLPHKKTSGPSGTQWFEDSFCEPSGPNEPPFPGLSPSSEPHEDVPACEPEPEVALIKSMEEPFEIPPIAAKNPNASSPHSHNEPLKEFTDFPPTLIIPQAIVHDSIN